MSIDRQDAVDELARAGELYEQYIALTSTTLALSSGDAGHQDFYAPLPAPPTLTWTWGNSDAIVERIAG